MEEGAGSRQAADRSRALGRSPRFRVSQARATCGRFSRETGEAAAAQAQRQLQNELSWLCVGK